MGGDEILGGHARDRKRDDGLHQPIGEHDDIEDGEREGWVVSFCFGLVHGFGFSSALRELGLPTQGLVLSLFGFNAGVELGQGLVVAAVLPVMVLVRNTRWEPRMMWSSSLAILLVGVVLFVERTFF